MSQDIVVEVEARTAQGKNAARRVRTTGMVPGILYGLDRPPFAVKANARRIEEILRLESGRNTVFRLQLLGADQPRAVMIRDLQRDPVNDALVHVDFVRVDLAKRVQVEVPVRLIGVPTGVKVEGGVIEFVTRQVEVECLPDRIPQHLDLDVTELHINQHASVKDLPRDAGVEILTDPEAIVVVVAAPRAEEAPAAEGAVAATPAEPEVIKKGKEASPAEGGEKK